MALSLETIAKIRKVFVEEPELTLRKIAERFGVHYQTVWELCKGLKRGEPK